MIGSDGLASALKAQVRQTVTTLYGRAARNWQKAPGDIARGLREARHLHSRERRIVADALHGMVRMRRRLAFALGLDAGEMAAPPPDSLYLAWLAGFAEERREALDVRLGDAMRRSALRTDPVPVDGIADPQRRLAIGASYPDWMVARLVDELGFAEASAFFHASNRRAPLIARANRLKNDRDELARLLRVSGVESKPVSLAPDALELDGHHNAYALPAFREGRFELQDTASQLIGEVVAPPPRGRVLDLCAGAGGKTLHLAALLKGAGRISACDVSDDKLEELRKRARRAGVSNMEAQRVSRDGPLELGAPYDRVLVDAPCTGTGVLRRNPEARWRLGPHDVNELPGEQRAILARAAAMVKADGRIIYATCSILRVENDDVIQAFLEASPGFERVPLKEILGTHRALEIGDGSVLRTSPQRHGADGFYAAVLRRRR